MRVLAPFAAALVLACALSARAQDEDPSALARSLFRDGVALARAERYEEAAERFRRAYEIRATPAIAFNLASALSHLGRLVEASEWLERILRSPELDADLRSATELQLEELRPRLARITIHLRGDAEGVTVRVDARELPAAAIGIAVPIDPGAHAIIARRGGQEVARGSVDVAAGASAEISLDVPEREREPEPARPVVPPEALTVTPERDEPARSDDTGIWVAVGIGIALAVGGAAVAIGVVASQPSMEAPIAGNTSPPILEWP
jgi:hypothetical protein